MDANADETPKNSRHINAGRRLVGWVAENSIAQKVRNRLPASLVGKVTGILRAVARPNGEIETGRIGDIQIALPNDQYYGRYGGNLNSYEPEVRTLIDLMCGENTLFVDCGANIGAFSSLAASKGCQVIAIEPGEATQKALAMNSEKYGFSVVRKAIYNQADLELDFNVSDNHAASSLTTGYSGNITHTSKVVTTTLDKIVAQHTTGNEDIVIKLDVEGVEPEAMQGARDIISSRRNALFIYEDHAGDRESKATKYMFDNGLKVYHVSVQRGKTMIVKNIKDTQELSHIKVGSVEGYNLVACIPGTGFAQEMDELCLPPLQTDRPSDEDKPNMRTNKNGNFSRERDNRDNIER